MELLLVGACWGAIFYVKERGFVEAALLCIGNELLDSNGDIHLVNEIYREKMH